MSEPGSATTAPGDESAAPTEESAGPKAGPKAGPEGELEAAPEAAPAPEPESTSRPWWVRRYTFTGTTLGLIFIWFSMTPSLLPRGALFQGLVSGFSGAIGYGLGVFGVWLVRYMRSQDGSPPPPRWAWKVLIPVGVVGMVLM